MFMPKFAAHAAPFKFSILASRSQQHFQHLRQTLNLNLGGGGASNAGQQAAGSVGGGAGAGAGAGGLGAANATGQGAAGAGGAKWHAGSRAGGWGYQQHGRLVTQAGSTSQDSSGRQNDDDDRDRDDLLEATALAVSRHRAISSRWRIENRPSRARRGRSSSTSGLSSSSHAPGELTAVRTQARFLHAFHDAREASEASPRPAGPATSRKPATERPHLRRTVSTSARQLDRPSRTNPVLSSRRRRASVGDPPAAVTLTRSASSVAADDSTPSPAVRVRTDRRSTSATPKIAEAEKIAKDAIVQVHAGPIHQAIKAALPTLDNSRDSVVAANFLLWGFATVRPRNYHAGTALELHRRILEVNGSASINTYSYLIYILAQRQTDIYHRRKTATLDQASRATAARFAQETGQPLEASELPPVRIKTEAEAQEPGVYRALDFYRSLGPAASRLAPAALDQLLDALSHMPDADVNFALPELAVEIFGHLEARKAYSAVSFAALVRVLGRNGDLEGAQEVYDDYEACVAAGKVLSAEDASTLPLPDGTTFEPARSKEVLFRTVGQHDRDHVLAALIGAASRASGPIAAVEIFEKTLTDASAPVSRRLVSEIILVLAKAGEVDAARRWIDRLRLSREVKLDGDRLEFFQNLRNDLVVAAEPGILPSLEAVTALEGLPLWFNVDVQFQRFARSHRRTLFAALETPGPSPASEALAEITVMMLHRVQHSEHHRLDSKPVARDLLINEIVAVGRICQRHQRLDLLERILVQASVADRESGQSLESRIFGLWQDGAEIPFDGLLSLASPGVLADLPFAKCAALAEAYTDQRRASGPAALQPAQWKALLHVGAAVHLQGDRAGSMKWDGLAALVEDFSVAFGRSPDDSDSAFFVAAAAAAESPSAEPHSLVERYLEEGAIFFANRFAVLQAGQVDAASRADSVEPVSADLAAATPSTAGDSVGPSSEASALFSPAPETQESVPGSPAPSSVALESQSGDGIAIPHPPFRTIDGRASLNARKLHLNKDQRAVLRFCATVTAGIHTAGAYLEPDAAADLINTLGRLKLLEQAREFYLYAHVALASGQYSPERQTALWVKVEDRMISALAHCGALAEIGLYKERLINAGEAPSADTYAAMIQHANETTDDASVALAYFEEAIRLGCSINTFLCNTVISKLSKARRGTEAMEVYEYMKLNGLQRNSVTFGAAINACCRTGDAARAEALFAEMTASPLYKPRIPPFNTMIQLYVQTFPNRERVLYYYDRLMEQGVAATEHTYSMLMQAYAFIEPADLASVDDVFARACADRNVNVEGTHWAALINARGCVAKDLDAAIATFDSILEHPSNQGRRLPDAVCYEALFNVFLALHRPDLIQSYVERMKADRIHMTAYVVNTLIRGHALMGDMPAARAVFDSLSDPPPGHAASGNHPTANNTRSIPARRGVTSGPVYREPSCYETMIRAEMGVGEKERAENLIRAMEARAYPLAVVHHARRLLAPVEPQTLSPRYGFPLTGACPPSPKNTPLQPFSLDAPWIPLSEVAAVA